VGICAPAAVMLLRSQLGAAVLLHSLHIAALLEYRDAGSRISSASTSSPPSGSKNISAVLFVFLGASVGFAAHFGCHAVGVTGVLALSCLVSGHLTGLLGTAPQAAGSRESSTREADRSRCCSTSSSYRFSTAMLVDAAGIVWISGGFSHMLLLRFDDGACSGTGAGMCLFLVLCVWNVDNGALFAGSAARALHCDPSKLQLQQQMQQPPDSCGPSSSTSSSPSSSPPPSFPPPINAPLDSVASSSSFSATTPPIPPPDPAAWLLGVPKCARTALYSLSPTKTWTGILGGLGLGATTGVCLALFVLARPHNDGNTQQASVDTEPYGSGHHQPESRPSSLSLQSSLPVPLQQLRLPWWWLQRSSGEASPSSSSKSPSSFLNEEEEEETCRVFLLSAPLPCWSSEVWVSLGLGVCVLAVVGDLLESAFKRAARVKVGRRRTEKGKGNMRKGTGKKMIVFFLLAKNTLVECLEKVCLLKGLHCSVLLLEPPYLYYRED
jgi:CDP-diglyceride synthetase